MSDEKRPFVIGLTGSIAMGKSTVADMFEALGVPVFDADAEVRAMQGPGGALVDDIEAMFPGSTGAQGVLRETLGAMVFGDRDKLALLETLIHPAVGKRRDAFLAQNAGAPLVVFDIPLLFEKTGTDGIDAVVVVSAAPDVQRSRVLAREGMTEEKFAQISSLQLSDAAKRARADYVIDTGVSMSETSAQVATLVDKLRTDLKREAS